MIPWTSCKCQPWTTTPIPTSPHHYPLPVLFIISILLLVECVPVLPSKQTNKWKWSRSKITKRMQNIPTIKRFGGASLHHHPPGVAFDFLSFAHSSTTIDANHTIRWCCCSDLFSVLKIQVNSLAGQTTIYFLLGEISPVWMDDGGHVVLGSCRTSSSRWTSSQWNK